MELNILFYGYVLVKGKQTVRGVFESRSKAITHITCYETWQKLSRRLEWNRCKRKGWKIKQVFVAVN